MDNLSDAPGLARFLATVLMLAAALWALIAAPKISSGAAGRRTLVWAVVLLLGQKVSVVLVAVFFSFLAPGSMSDSIPIYAVLSWVELIALGTASVGLFLLGREFSSAARRA